MLTTLFRQLMILLSFALCCQSALAAERLAVLDLRAVGVDDNLALAVSENLRTMIIGNSRYTVIERSQLKPLLDELSLEESGLTEQEHALHIGKLANVDLILVGSLDKIFDCYSINTRIVHIDSGEVVKALQATILSHADFPAKIDHLAARITADGADLAAPQQQITDICGSYHLTGADYSGQLTITADHELLRLHWQIDNEQAPHRQIFNGFGLLHNSTISAYYQCDEDKSRQGLASYQVLLGGQQLRGLYADFGSDQRRAVQFENAIRLNERQLPADSPQ